MTALRSETDFRTTREVAGSHAISRAGWSQRDHERGSKPVQTAATASDGSGTKVLYPSERELVDTAGSPRAGSPQGGSNAALESHKEGSDQGVGASPTPDTASRPPDESASSADTSQSARQTIETFEQFIAENKSEPDQETTVIETDAMPDDLPYEPPDGSLPNDTRYEMDHPIPHTFHPSHRRTGRRVVTVFSGYDGFREAAAEAGSIWQAIAGCEDIHQNRKAKIIAALWDDVNPHGKIVGDYADLIGGLEPGTL